jgi:hypothetical protein
MLDALFAGGAAWFTVPALLGTGIFLVKMALMLMGGSDDLDVGGDASAGHAGMDSHGGGHDGHGHTNSLMAIASLQGVSAFMTGFGWAGLGAYQGMKWSMLASMGVGLLGGIAMGLIFVGLLTTTRKLQTSGNIDFSRAKGSEGEVYATVPASGQGRGQVRLVIGGRQRIVQATSANSEVPTGKRVRVIEAKADNSVVVEAV